MPVFFLLVTCNYSKFIFLFLGLFKISEVLFYKIEKMTSLEKLAKFNDSNLITTFLKGRF